MRTFNEVKELEFRNQCLIMERMRLKLKTGELHNTEVIGAKGLLQKSENNINNMDEVTRIKIGAATNSLISAIQRVYKYRAIDYNNQFERFMSEYIIGVTPDEFIGSVYKSNRFIEQSDCYILGITLEDLMIFKGRNPLSTSICDDFRNLVNINFGTSIPMAGVEEQAFNDYLDANVEETNKAFVHLRELQRDSGTLYFGGSYHLLAADKEYQIAKARCAESNIQM